jgi:hypothetical protein
MVWKGVVIKESLKDESVLDFVRIIKSRKTTLENEGERGFLTFLSIELEDGNKNIFVKKASSLIKDGFYIHIVEEDRMAIIYRNRVFEFSSKDMNKLEEARNYGLSIGILREQMSFEDLIKNPYS